MTERDAFLLAIRDEPRELLHRRAFADWLDDHDEPELADFHRSWTVQRYDEAAAFLEGFADSLNEGYMRLTADDLVETMRTWVEGREWGDYVHLPYDTPDQCYSDRPHLWECFEVVTGVKVAEDRKNTGFFSCSC